MAKKKEKKPDYLSKDVTIADNRRARFDYHIEEKFVAGIELTGTEVKSLRLGQCSLNEAHVGPHRNEMWVHGMHIPEYQQAGNAYQHEPRRNRRLLMKRKEIEKLLGAVTREGYTVIPLKIYFNGRGLAKLEIALAKGKKLHDKREDTKKRDWNRDKARIMKDRG